MDYEKLRRQLEASDAWEGSFELTPIEKSADMVDHPSHYTSGKTEVIDVIEDAITPADDPVKAMLQAQVLKYLLRMWLKEDPLQDAKKAQWYLNRLIEKMDDVYD